MTAIPSPDDIAGKLVNLSNSDAGKYLSRLAGFSPSEVRAKEKPVIVLGSRSPRRELILGKLLGIKHKCHAIDVDEHLPSRRYPADIVSKCLAAQKFLGYARNMEGIMKKGNVLVVSDTIVFGQNGKIMGKEPSCLKTNDEKYEFCHSRIMEFMGKKTIVFSSVACCDFRTGRVFIDCDSVAIYFRRPDSREVEIIERYCRYIYNKNKVRMHRGPLGKAGSFGIQEPEILFLVEKIKGDITVAIGLPANLTLNILNMLPGIRFASKYNPEECVNIIFSEAVSEKIINGINLREHALSLMTN